MIQVIISMSIFLILMGSVFHFSGQMSSQIAAMDFKSQLLGEKQKIYSAVTSDEIWNSTFNHSQNNSNLRCLKVPSQNCGTSIQNRRITLFYPGNQEVFPGFANRTIGLSKSGFCQGYGSTANPKTCPMGIDIFFERICATPCTFPIVKIIVRFQYDPRIKHVPVNTNTLSFEFFRSANPSSQILTHHDEPWTDPGSIHPTRSNVRYRTRTFTVNLPVDGILVSSVSTKGRWPAGNPPYNYFQSQSNIFVDGLKCNSGKGGISNTSLLVGTQRQSMSSVSCHRSLSAGTHTLTFEGSVWTGSTSIHPIIETSENGTIGFTVFRK